MSVCIFRLKTLETARDIIIRRRLAPINHRWIRPSIVTAIKLSDSARLELIHKTNFVKSTVVPRSLRSKLDIMLMGQRINILDVDMRAEGIQEILTKLFGIVPTESNAPKTNDKIEVSKKKVEYFDISTCCVYVYLKHANNFCLYFFSSSIAQLLCRMKILNCLQTSDYLENNGRLCINPPRPRLHL